MKDVCKIGAVLTSSISTRLFSWKEKEKKVGVEKNEKNGEACEDMQQLDCSDTAVWLLLAQ